MDEHDEKARSIMALVTRWLEDDSLGIADEPVPQIAAALRAAAAEGAREWRPIETAPRDGRLFVAFYEGGHGPQMGPMSWQPPVGNEKDGRFFSWAVLTETKRATHWQPLPAPPATEQQREG